MKNLKLIWISHTNVSVPFQNLKQNALLQFFSFYGFNAPQEEELALITKQTQFLVGREEVLRIPADTSPSSMILRWRQRRRRAEKVGGGKQSIGKGRWRRWPWNGCFNFNPRRRPTNYSYYCYYYNRGRNYYSN